MSKKALRRHRKLHAIKIPCPICAEFRPDANNHLIVKRCLFVTYENDIMWDGRTIYLNKEVMENRKEKNQYVITCSGEQKCAIDDCLEEEDIQKILMPYLETILQELVRTPPPPKWQGDPGQQGSKKNKKNNQVVHIQSKPKGKWRFVLKSRERKEEDVKQSSTN